MPLVDGLYESIKDALKLINGINADTTAVVKVEDKKNRQNKWPISDFLLTIDPALTVLP